MEFLHHRIRDLGRVEPEPQLIPRATPYRPSRGDWLRAAIVAAGLFALYAATSPRTVALEDDGMFVLSSYFLGIEHPPGYPIFTLLGKLFTLLPVGSIAYRVHLLSALLGALSCAALWLCARQLIEGALPAYLAAIGFGLSRTFWSQAIIAEVYTFNTLFLFVLVYLGLRAWPPSGPASGRFALPAITFVFALSLANHWPLMLLVAPGFAILLWPRAGEALRRAPVLVPLFLLGLTPYAWLVVRSWAPLPISFYGPLESWREIWFFLSRAGYAEVDVSHTATWLDRVRFFAFFGTEFLAQFALAGSVLGMVGFAVQWRIWGRRVSSFLTAAFLGPSAVLLLLLNFDFDALHKHVFHVYPLPAFGIAALWMGLGFAWLVQRFRLPVAAAGAACAALLGLVFAVGAHWNLKTSDDWAARYGQTLLDALPRDAIVVARGDWDLIPIAYFHMIEGRRPDLTLVQPTGLTLGNRLFHPLRTTEEGMKTFLTRSVDAEHGVVAVTPFAASFLVDYPLRDHWLYQVVEKSPGGSAPSFDVPEEFVRFFEQSILSQHETNPWAANLQGELRRKYARLLATDLPRSQPPDPRSARHIEALADEFYGALGLVEGLLSNPRGYSAGQAIGFLERVRHQIPSDANKSHVARYFQLRGYLRWGQHDERGALEDLETAVSLWPVKENAAIAPLMDHYVDTGNEAALQALRARLKR